MATGTHRQTADERREAILEAAMVEFAERGLHGTSTERIAERAGISQPYLFRLFGTKKELFLAASERCFRRTLEAFQAAAERARRGEALPAMGRAYMELLSDRRMLLLQMQTYAACDDPDVRAVVRERFAELYRYVERASGASGEEVRAFVARGMLSNVAATLNLPEICSDDDWARRFLARQ